MKITEINEMRVKQQKLLEEKNTAHQSFNEAHMRIMEDLDEQERIAHDDLIKRIKKHFKGIMPHITINNRNMLINYDDLDFLNHKYGSTTFEGISKKLANKIIAEYEEVYGEIEKDVKITSTVFDQMGLSNIQFPSIFGNVTGSNNN